MCIRDRDRGAEERTVFQGSHWAGARPAGQHLQNGRWHQCAGPACGCLLYTSQLRDKHDVTISAVPKGGRERQEYSMPSIDHEAEQHINAQEAEFGADAVSYTHLDVYKRQVRDGAEL